MTGRSKPVLNKFCLLLLSVCMLLLLPSLQVLLLNNQHLGMVVQWEDRFYKVGVLLDRVLTGLPDRLLTELALRFRGSHHPNGAAAVLSCSPAVWSRCAALLTRADIGMQCLSCDLRQANRAHVPGQA